MTHKRPLKQVQLQITHYDGKTGYGLGALERPEGLSDQVEVPFTMPGDQVMVEFGRKRGGVYHARLLEIVSPSSARETPLCEHFAQCGGCRWQHVPYVEQLRLKQETVLRQFEQLKMAETQIFPIVGCEPPWQYRNKMEFSFSSDAKGERYLGLMLANGRQRVVTLNACYLVNPWFVEALKATREWWIASGVDAYHPYKDTGSLRTLTVREGIRTGDRMAILTVSGNPEFALSDAQLAAWVETMQSHLGTSSLFVRTQCIAKGHPTQFVERHLSGSESLREELHLGTHHVPLVCKISPSAFFQPSTRQAEKLYTRAMELAQLKPTMCVYDLYCGTGTLGMAAARHVRRVVGVELSVDAVNDARCNAACNDLNNIEFIAGDVAQVLAQRGSQEAPDLVIVDPPRVGLGAAAIAQVLSLRPEQILYVSCNPRTQAQDIAAICAQGYQLVALQPVDQFAHTVHVENIALLKRMS
jgi:23S rRNA (uracil1939-C5)-methyltransferase